MPHLAGGWHCVQANVTVAYNHAELRANNTEIMWFGVMFKSHDLWKRKWNQINPRKHRLLFSLTDSAGSWLDSSYRNMASILDFYGLVLVVILTFISKDVVRGQPEQIHMAFTGVSSERIVNYVTQSQDVVFKTVALYGKDSKQLNKKSVGKSYPYPLPENQEQLDSRHHRNLTIHNVKVGVPKSEK